MHTKSQSYWRWLAVPLVLALAVLACGGPAVEPSATPFLKPTQQLAPTAKPTTAPPTARPTQPPEPTKPPPSAFTLSSEPFVHKSGAFSILLPEGWEVKERDNSVFVNSPDSVASIEISFINAGVALDEDDLADFIAANEANWFASFNNYEQTAYEPQSDGSIGVLKTLELSGGTPQKVFSYYWQEGTVVYEQDFWVNTAEYDGYVDGFLEVANSMQTDARAGAQAPVYAITYTFSDQINGLFEFEVPYAWTYKTDSSDNAVVDTFTSPDGLAIIENIAFDDGRAVSKSDAGRFALALLKNYYKVDDIKVTGDEVQPDGSERLDWNSPSRGFKGQSFFETRGTTFLLLTWVASNDYYETYRPVWSKLLSSYESP